MTAADRAFAEPRPWRLLPAVGTFILFAAVAFDHGGYFPGPWGWTILVAAWGAGLALFARGGATISRPAIGVAVLLAAFTGWTALSSVWTVSSTQTALEVQRVGVYAIVFLAAALWIGRARDQLLGAAWAAITIVCCWSLLTRLVPDHFGVDYVGSGNRLTSPVGYWNSLGIFAAAGAILGLALAVESGSRWLRGFAAASLPLLVTTLYFTYSRGAWLCLAVGLLAYWAASPRRTRLVVGLAALAPWMAIAVWRASVSKPLTAANPPIGAAAHDGHRLVVLLLVLAACSALVAVLLVRLDSRLELPAGLVWPARAVVVVLAVVVLIAGATHVHKAWHSFSTSTTGGSTLNGRLFTFGGNGRVGQWRIAWHEFKAHPIVGTGARTYEIYWTRDRTKNYRVRDVHNLYLQALAELGIVGFLVLVGALGIPLVTGVRARRQPLLAAAFGVYVAYLVHAIVDWDWEITGVMLPFLICAAALTSAHQQAIGGWARRVALACAVVFAIGGIYSIAARYPMNRLSTAVSKQQWAKAHTDAQRASDLAPWSSEPWLALGEGEVAAGLTPQAAAAFRIATHRDRDNWVAWWDLARATRGTERVAALLHVKQLNPDAPKAD